MTTSIQIHNILQPVLEADSEKNLVEWNKGAQSLFPGLYHPVTGKLTPEQYRQIIPVDIADLIHNCTSEGIDFISENNLNIQEQWFGCSALPLASGGALIFLKNETSLKLKIDILQESEQKARHLFDELPIIIWEEDFSDVKNYLNELRKEIVITDIEKFLTENPEVMEKAASLIRVININKKSYDFYNADTLDELLTAIPFWFIDESWEVFTKELAALDGGAYEFTGELPVKSPKGVIKYLIISVFVPEPNRKTLNKVIVSFIDITDRVMAERKLKDSLRELTQLSHHLEKIREEERKHIAREIHDHAGSLLTILKLDFFSFIKVAGPLKKAVKVKSDELLSHLNELNTLIHSISASLRPSILDTMGLLVALKWQAEEYSRHAGLKLFLMFNVAELKLPDEIAIGVFRIFQEAFNNIIKHAFATEVIFNISKLKETMQMQIIDNGKGFQYVRIEDMGPGQMGLKGMMERAAMIKGEIDISSHSGDGTMIILKVPIT